MSDYVWSMPDSDWDNRGQVSDYIGSCRTGNLCFDIVIQWDADCNMYLTYDCYIGGIDDGYGYGRDGYPYTYGGGGGWDSLLPGISKKEFQEMAEKRFSAFITANRLESKANEELRIW